MKRTQALAAFTSAIAALAVLYACSGDDSSPGNNATPQDSGTILNPQDSGPITPTNDATPPPNDAGPNCFSGTPTTYLEIINACTNAQAIDKHVDLSSMNLPDGGLQPLP